MWGVALGGGGVEAMHEDKGGEPPGGADCNQVDTTRPQSQKALQANFLRLKTFLFFPEMLLYATNGFTLRHMRSRLFILGRQWK